LRLGTAIEPNTVEDLITDRPFTKLQLNAAILLAMTVQAPGERLVDVTGFHEHDWARLTSKNASPATLSRMHGQLPQDCSVFSANGGLLLQLSRMHGVSF